MYLNNKDVVQVDRLGRNRTTLHQVSVGKGCVDSSTTTQP